MITKNTDLLWTEFSNYYHLSDEQVKQFKQFYAMLKATNDIHNLTAIMDLRKVVPDHFKDSLALGQAIDLAKVSSIADIGSGGGFPGIPLKILYPHLKLFLIEVNHKKVEFLHEVIEALGLQDCIVSDIDWRNFLRKTDYSIELFCARASLQTEELIRLFKPASPYNKAKLIYWASRHWEPLPRVVPFIKKEVEYFVNKKERRLIFFEAPL